MDHKWPPKALVSLVWSLGQLWKMVHQMVILLRDWGTDLFSLSFLLPSDDVNSLFSMCFPHLPEAIQSTVTGTSKQYTNKPFPLLRSSSQIFYSKEKWTEYATYLLNSLSSRIHPCQNWTVARVQSLRCIWSTKDPQHLFLRKEGGQGCFLLWWAMVKAESVQFKMLRISNYECSVTAGTSTSTLLSYKAQAMLKRRKGIM